MKTQKKHLKKIVMRKLLLTAAILGTGLLLTAGLFSEVVELRAKQPLIDLDLYVKDSEPGQGGNPESGLEGAAETEPESSAETETEAEPETVPEAEEAKRSAEILVEIRDTGITVNGSRCSDLKEMLSKVKDCYRVGLKIVLRDSYAEYRTYREVYEALRSQHYTVTEEEAE